MNFSFWTLTFLDHVEFWLAKVDSYLWFFQGHGINHCQWIYSVLEGHIPKHQADLGNLEVTVSYQIVNIQFY